MKFTKYLRDSQTPEWKRAYIDYRGLKKHIAMIRRAKEEAELNSFSTPLTKLTMERPSKFSADDRGLEIYTGPGFLIPPVVSGTQDDQSSELTGQEGSAQTRPPSPRIQEIIVNAEHLRPRPLSSRLSKTQSQLIDPMVNLPLQELLTHLTPQEMSFFHRLDAELEKIETFYMSREKELLIRTQMLREQLSKLQNHRNLVYQADDGSATWTSAVLTTLKLKHWSYPVIEISNNDSHSNNNKSRGVSSALKEGNNAPEWHSAHLPVPHSNKTQKTRTNSLHDPGMRSLSPGIDDYLHAERQLDKAVVEHYRGLELLSNYRMLNLTGFRKALKKFVKATKIRAQEQYMTEKVDQSALGSDKALREMMTEMQTLYAQVFRAVHGSSKKAMERLRGGVRPKTHHFSTFRSGILLGAALPALASGIYQSTFMATHDYVQDALLCIYGIVFIPVVFSMLIGLNLLVWAHCNINYTFIVELDVQTRMNYREYYEIPSFLFSTLCYAFWLSSASVGAPHVSPTIWPLVWLALTATIMFNPLPLLFRSSRSWLLKTIGKLLISGARPVKFADFWMGDQFCSLVFTLSNLYTFVCIYAKGFQEDWSSCRTQSNAWPVAFILAILPFLVRLAQSLKRYADSGLITHLINGGKYGFGIINYLFYFLWRHQETQYNPMFALYVIFTAIYSVYATCWDLLMDWSLLQPRAKHFLLRNELGYSGHTYPYYFAIITNCLIRFAWVLYIPQRGPNELVRTFIVGFLEMLRRVQWNFYRLENEHLGNMDQYRVTREVPLPYLFDHGHQGEGCRDRTVR